MNREEMESIITRNAIGTGENSGMNRKQFNHYLIKCYGADMKALLKEFWDKRYLTVDGYKEVTLTKRWADYRNSKNYGIQIQSSEEQKEPQK
jgi:hypothetical protein